MDVQVEELRAIVDKLFGHLEATGRCTVDVPYDYYWSIPKEKQYDPYNEPSELTIGQITDDLSELRRIANDDAPPISYALVWLASILKAIGETTVD